MAFPIRFRLCGEPYAMVPPIGPFQITFWDHLCTTVGTCPVVAGFEFHFMRGNDDIIMDSSFCRADLRNLKRTSSGEDYFSVEVHLSTETQNVASDCCQAFGSLYYTDGYNVAIAIMNWDNGSRYGFPISSDDVSAVEW